MFGLCVAGLGVIAGTAEMAATAQYKARKWNARVDALERAIRASVASTAPVEPQGYYDAKTGACFTEAELLDVFVGLRQRINELEGRDHGKETAQRETAAVLQSGGCCTS